MISFKRRGGMKTTVDLTTPFVPPPKMRRGDISQPNVGFVEGTRLRFSDETAGLLRSRLTAVTLILSVILALAFVANLFSEYAPLVGIRAVVVVAYVGSLATLRSSRRLSLVQLRWLEATLFGALWSNC